MRAQLSMVLWISIVVVLMLLPTLVLAQTPQGDPAPSNWPSVAPSGDIGTPISTHKPPREPRLTMPPTDTAG